jgi:isopenicillin N synthase-like dioxygenase
MITPTEGNFPHQSQARNANQKRYFPPQPGSDNLKEGFELGPPGTQTNSIPGKFNLTEPSVFPSAEKHMDLKERLGALHVELQELSITLLSLLALALGQKHDFFADYTRHSLSTLRLLHYPPPPIHQDEGMQELICTPHTDSGILTLLHQDQTGGLEVRSADGEWIPAPYVPGSIVVNIGDLMARVSGGRWVATFHRVRSSPVDVVAKTKEIENVPWGRGEGMGRYSVPFFFEPGYHCLIRGVGVDDEGVRYGEHVLGKMSTWVEFQDVERSVEKSMEVGKRPLVEVY